MCSYAKPFEGGNVVTNPPETTTNPPTASTNPPGITTNPPETSTIPPETSASLTELTTIAPELTTAAANISEPIPIYERLCIIAAIKQNFYSILGNQYCVDICQGKPMSVCNLYICYCVTEEKLKKCLA